MKKYTVAVAGSTKKTTLCAEALKSDGRFEILWILTPKPKPVGRKKVISPNPLDNFAKENNLSVIYVEKKIDNEIKTKILDLKKDGSESVMLKPADLDFLLVVDFGYLIPNWLLELPKIAPLNIHPSELPKWRGNSPGQFSILFNDEKSAVTLMKINDKFDQGPIIHQDFFEVDKSWNQEDYYVHAFNLICDKLGGKIIDNVSAAKPQPEESKTITAKKLTKDQTFVDWKIVETAIRGGNLKNKEVGSNNDSGPQLSKLLSAALEHNKFLALTLERASKAFSPWPSLWTIISTQKGDKRMKLLDLEIEEKDGVGVEIDENTKTAKNKKLILKTVQIEGKNPTSWSEVKNIISE